VRQVFGWHEMTARVAVHVAGGGRARCSRVWQQARWSCEEAEAPSPATASCGGVARSNAEATTG